MTIPPPQRPSAFLRSGDPVTLDTAHEERLSAEVRRVAVEQLVAGGQLVEFVHVAGVLPGTIGAKRPAALLHELEAIAEAGDVAQARALGARFAEESAAATAYVRRARQGAG